MVSGGGEDDRTQWLKITCVNFNYISFTKKCRKCFKVFVALLNKITLINHASLSKKRSYFIFRYVLKRN